MTQFKVLGFYSSEIEVRDLVKAWVAISLAFAILLTRFELSALSFMQNFILSGFTVGTAFLLHEMGHKVVAQRYKCFAEFRSFDNMLVLAIALSFLGFIFAAPGAVMIQGRVDTVRNGKISAAGPLVNILLAVLFLMAFQVYSTKTFSYGFMINSWIGLFNMIPLGNFDGRKILAWNKAVWIAMVVITGFFVWLGFQIGFL
jgi:Zn-dependent protease